MQSRLINLSILLNEYRDRVHDLVRCSASTYPKELQERLFSEVFIDIFKSIKNTKVKHPTHILVYIKAKDAILKHKKTLQKKQVSIKNLKAPLDISAIQSADLKGLKGTDVLDLVEPVDRVLIVLALRHHMNINELATIFSTSTGAIFSRLNRIKMELANIAISSLKSPKELAGYEESKLCFSIKKMEPQYSLGALNKDDQNKVSRHLSRCAWCKNFYSWNQRVLELVEAIEQEKAPIAHNRAVFEKLEKKAIDERLIHHIRTGWKVRLSIFIAVLIGLAGLSYFFYFKKFYPLGAKRYAAEQIVIIDDTVATPIKTTLDSVNELIKGFPVIEQTVSENEKNTHYTLIIQAKDKELLFEKIRAINNVKIEQATEAKRQDKNVKVEVWIDKNG